MYPVVLFGSIMELILNGFVLPILYLKKSKVHETMHIKNAAIHLCYMLELYHGGAWFMVYTSGAVSIEFEGVTRVFYSKQKPRVCTINHKPRHGTTVLYNAIAQGLIWARIVHAAIGLRRGATA